jgi:hypothetical protein
MTKVTTLNLADVKTAAAAHVYAGRIRGTKCREFFKVESLDNDHAVLVKIFVPKDTLAVTTSFLLSFLGPSIKKAGSEAAFARKYTFECPDYILPSIREGIERALKPAGSDAISTALGAR